MMIHFLGYVLVVLTIAPIVCRGEGMTEDQRQVYAGWLDRIITLDKTRDLRGLEMLAKDVHAKRLDAGPECYGRVMVRLVQTLGSSSFGDDRQYALEREFAVTALSDARLPVEVESDLVQHVWTPLRSMRRPLGDKWSKQRVEEMTLWFHVWKRVVNAIDPQWDVAKDAPKPIAFMEGVPAIGMSPDQVQDPVLRERYKAAIAEHNKQQQKWNAQIEARKREKSFSPIAERYIVRVYSTPPFNNEELSGYLDKHIGDAAIKQRILEQVRSNQDAMRR